MNWFKLLKVQTQTQRQGFRLDDKDEAYVLEEDDECFEQLLKYIGSFFNGKPEIREYSGELPLDAVWEDNTGFVSIARGYTKPYPDEYYCRIKKWIEENLANHDKNVEYRHQDSDLSYKFYTNYDNNPRYGKSGGYNFFTSIATREGIGRLIAVIDIDIKFPEGGESS